MLDVVLVYQGDVAGEVACLCWLEGHRQCACRTGCNVLCTLRYIKLVGRRCEVFRRLHVAILSTKHAVATVGKLYVYGLSLADEQVAKVDKLLAVQFGFITVDCHLESHLLLRVLCLVRLDVDVEVVCAVYEFLSVIRECYFLAFARTNLAADRLRIEHLAPVGVLAYSLHRPCKVVGNSLEA